MSGDHVRSVWLDSVLLKKNTSMIKSSCLLLLILIFVLFVCGVFVCVCVTVVFVCSS